MAADMPWFPFWASDFVSSRTVKLMEPAEIGTYLLMLCEQWMNGPLPDDPDAVATLLPTAVDVNTVATVLERCFNAVPNGRANARLEEVREEQHAKHAQKVRAGRASAKARKDKMLEKSTALEQRSNGVPTALQRCSNESDTESEEEVTTTPPPKSSSPLVVEVGRFLDRTDSDWRLRDPIAAWCAEVEREPKYAGADLCYEVRKAADYYSGKGKRLKAPDMALRNWLERAGGRARAAPSGRRNPYPRLA